MKLKKRIGLAAVLLSVIPLIVSNSLTNLSASKQANETLHQVSEARLISLRDTQKQRIEDYFSNIENQLLNLANSSLIANALVEFTHASSNYAQQTGIDNQTQLKAQLEPYYLNDFSARYAEKNAGKAPTNAKLLLDKLSVNGLALQNTFIAQNPAPLGEKHSLVETADGTQYSEYHSKYHPFLRDFLNRFGYYDIFLVDADSGMVVYSVFKELDFATSLKNGAYADTGLGQAFQQAMKTKDRNSSYIADFSPYMPSYEDPASFIAAPIFVDGVKKGAIIFQMPIDHINEIMTFHGKWADAGLGESGETYLVGLDKLLRSESRFFIEDKPGFINALKQSGTVSEEEIQLLQSKNSGLDIQKVDSIGSKMALSGEQGFDIFPDYRGINVLSAYAPLNIHGLNWAILAEMDESEAFAAADKLVDNLWVYGGFILIIMALISSAISMKLSSYITTPIIQIADFISDAGRNLNLTKRLNMQRQDEIGEASTAFNNMLDTMQKTLHEVTETSSNIAATAEQTSVVTDQTTEAVKQQQSQTTLVASAMNQMTATVNEVAKNISQTSSATDHASVQVESGLLAMKQTIELIKELANITESTSQTITSLEERSRDISGILDVINNIAEQTNLLALNASIEAARAGEHGRGFTVVADEVRTLANKTTQSTAEVRRMIEHLQTGSNDAVFSINKSLNHVNSAVSQADSTGEALTAIAEVIKHINQMSEQIATAAEEQSSVAEEINRNIVAINDMTTQTATGAVQTSEANKLLAEAAVKLTTLVKQFQVA